MTVPTRAANARRSIPVEGTLALAPARALHHGATMARRTPTIPVDPALHHRLEQLARARGVTLAELAREAVEAGLAQLEAPRSLAGFLRGGRVPDADEIRSVRRDLSASLSGRRPA